MQQAFVKRNFADPPALLTRPSIACKPKAAAVYATTARHHHTHTHRHTHTHTHTHKVYEQSKHSKRSTTKLQLWLPVSWQPTAEQCKTTQPPDSALWQHWRPPLIALLMCCVGHLDWIYAAHGRREFSTNGITLDSILNYLYWFNKQFRWVSGFVRRRRPWIGRQLIWPQHTIWAGWAPLGGAGQLWVSQT